MPKNVIDYSKCVIYKICCKDPSVTYEYYGHTTDKTRRKQEHKCVCNNQNHKKHNLKIYQVIRENDGWDNWDFIIIEDYPCQNVDEARLRERYWIELKQSTLNTNIPGRTSKEYRQDNFNTISKNHKKYYDENKEILLDKQKKYYEENKCEMNSKRLKKVECECGSEVARCTIARHRKSQKHINRLNQINNQTQANENDGCA